MSTSGKENARIFDIGQRLYCDCLVFFSALSQEKTALKPLIDNDTFNEELGRLYLWGEGFRGSRLDVLIASFRYLRISILRRLITIGNLLRDNVDFSRSISNDLRNAADSLGTTIKIANRALPLELGTDDCESLGDDGASDSSGSSVYDFIDDLHFYITLLMSLAPSMDRSLAQIAKDRQKKDVNESSDSKFKHSSHPETAATAIPEVSVLGAQSSSDDPTNVVDEDHWVERDAAARADKDFSTDLTRKATETTKTFQNTSSLVETQELRAEKPTVVLPQDPEPPPYSVMPSLPFRPTRPQTKLELKFRNLLLTLSLYPLKFENPGLLEEALALVPLDRIYSDAEEEHNVMKALAMSVSESAMPKWGYQDCVVVGLLRWFKRDFFSFVANPPCPVCSSTTVGQGYTPKTDDEAARGATKVELYKCTAEGCGSYERFPRYSDVWMLLQTRKGRVGEFANCFGMFCRAIGTRVRWVWNSEDHVWIETYSDHQRRWIHVDACEEKFDQPTMYTEGWGRKLAYCIAFSTDGATDVTRRYVRNWANYGLGRTKTSEETLSWILLEIRRIRREKMEKAQMMQLVGDDLREERELAGYVAKSLVDQVVAESSNDISRSDSLKAREVASDLALRGTSDADQGRSEDRT